MPNILIVAGLVRAPGRRGIKPAEMAPPWHEDREL